MTVEEFVRGVGDEYRAGGLRAAGRGAVEEGVYGLSRRLGRVYGENLFEREWDVAIILDACRYDALAGVAGEYDWLPTDVGEPMYSCGSATPQWLDHAVVPEVASVLGETTYVTANPQINRHGRDDLFDRIVQTRAWDDVTRADVRRVTEAAIRAGREHDNERLLVHHLPPHFPSVADPVRCDEHATPHRCVRAGEISVGRLWTSYVENLRFALDEVALLRENLDADRVVITADHGELFGEFGLYRHPPLPLPTLRRVPWVRIDASDERTLDPDIDLSALEGDAVDEAVDERLRPLGYV